MPPPSPLGKSRARSECIRRVERREERKAQKARTAERRAMFLLWAETGNYEAYKAFLAIETAKWDRIIDAVWHYDRHSRELWQMRRGAAFKRHHADWRKALTGGWDVTPKPRFRTKMDALDRMGERIQPKQLNLARPALPSFLRKVLSPVFTYEMA